MGIYTRLTKLPEHNNVLVGRDLDEVFESGHVYSIRKILGEFVVEDLGLSSINDTSVNDHPNKHSEIGSIVLSGRTFVTQEEYGD